MPGSFCGALKVIPEMNDTQRDALNMCHNKFVGHGGVKRTVEKLLSLPFDWVCGLTRTLGAGAKGCWNAGEGKGVMVLLLGITMWLAYR